MNLYNYDEWRRKKSCEFKRRMTMVQAYHEAEQRGPEFRSYRCAFCGWYHVGHRQPGQGVNEWTGR